MKVYTIYVATNTVNLKRYVGFDSAWPKRKQSHKDEAHNPSSHTYSTKFHRAIRKYGWDNFTWEPIYQSLDGHHTLNTMERYFIEQYNTYTGVQNNWGYNLTLGGDGQLGRVMSEETKRKKSQALRGRPTNQSRSVHTPLGTFPGVRMAAEHHGLHHRTVLERIKRASFPDWFFSDSPTKAEINVLRTGTAKQICTPHGTYDSIRECSEQLGIPVTTVQYRVTSVDQPDWYFTGRETKRGTRRIITPLGTFESVADAAKVHGISASTVRAKLSSTHNTDWKYNDA